MAAAVGISCDLGFGLECSRCYCDDVSFLNYLHHQRGGDPGTHTHTHTHNKAEIKQGKLCVCGLQGL